MTLGNDFIIWPWLPQGTSPVNRCPLLATYAPNDDTEQFNSNVHYILFTKYNLFKMMNQTRIQRWQRRARIVWRTNNNIPTQTLYVYHGHLDFSTKPTSLFFCNQRPFKKPLTKNMTSSSAKRNRKEAKKRRKKERTRRSRDKTDASDQEADSPRAASNCRSSNSNAKKT